MIPFSQEWFDMLNKEVEAGNVRVAKSSDKPLKIYNYTHRAQFLEHWNEVTRKTRGLILNDRNPVVIPPEKFFNLGEKFAAPVNLLSARISEKLDGIMIIIKADSDWGLIITSRGSFDNKYTEAAKKFLTDDVAYKLIPNYTYFCELCQNFPGDEAIILTQHPEPKLVCWAIMDSNFHEIIPDDTCPFPIAKELSLGEAKLYLQQKVEGIVAQDLITFERVKIKTDYFIQHHRLLSDCTKKRAWEVLSSGNKIEDLDIPDEFIKQMKQYEKELQDEYDRYWQKIGDIEYKTSHLTDKELGLLDDYQEFKPFLFLLRKDRWQECLDKIWQKIKPTNVV